MSQPDQPSGAPAKTDPAAILESARTLLAPWTGSQTTPEPDRLDVYLEAGTLEEAVKTLHAARWGYLSAIIGLDLGVESGKLEVLYAFCSGPVIVTLRVQVSREPASIPSIAGIIPYASLYERETSEMFGITVIGTPDPSRLFLADDWPADIYPLRKDALIEKVAPGSLES